MISFYIPLDQFMEKKYNLSKKQVLKFTRALLKLQKLVILNPDFNVVFSYV